MWSKIILTKGCRLVFMSNSNADLIAVSLACPKDPKSPSCMGPSSQQCPKAPGESTQET